MTLDELNELKRESQKCESAASGARQLSNELASIRNGEKPLMVAYKGLGSWNDELKSVIEAAINECGIDLLRIAEMRQDAFARLKSGQASQKLAAISAALGQEQGGSK